jgi:DHHC palmitoyltransferase
MDSKETMDPNAALYCPPVQEEPGDGENQRDEDEWQRTWREFKQALYAPATQDFAAFYWVRRLFGALITRVYTKVQSWLFPRPDCCRSGTCQHRQSASSRSVTPSQVLSACIPIFGLSLIALIALAYVTTLRLEVVYPRWCQSKVCYSLYIHDAITFYFIIMISFHYWQACFLSPGVMLLLPKPTTTADGTVTMADSVPTTVPRRALQGQGGFYGWDPPPYNVAQEQAWEELFQDDDTSATKSYCAKCQHSRPRHRCHHCSTTNQCVLRYDHHCVWVNNAIGHGNYRYFVLLLLYLAAATIYACAMLFFDFYEPLVEQVRVHGWHWNYSHRTGFLNLPPLSTILYQLFSGRGLETKVVIDLLYPLFLALACILTIFAATHLKYVATAQTTLEYHVALQQKFHAAVRALQQQQSPPESRWALIKNQISSWWQRPPAAAAPASPYDQGWFQNFHLVLNLHAWHALFLPIPVAPLPPYIPPSKNPAATLQDSGPSGLPKKQE